MITIKEYTEELETENRTLYGEKNYWKRLAEKRKFQLQQKETRLNNIKNWLGGYILLCKRTNYNKEQILYDIEVFYEKLKEKIKSE